MKWLNRHSTAHVSDVPANITTEAAGNVYVTGLASTARTAVNDSGVRRQT